MINVNHYTMNTEHNVIHKDDSVLWDNIRTHMQKMISEACEKGKADVLDGTVMRLVYDEDSESYMSTLFKDGEILCPILETAGACTEEGAEMVWEQMLMFYEQCYGKEDAKKLKRPAIPFICDFIFPTVFYAPQVVIWTGDYTKTLGFSMFEIFEKESKKNVFSQK